MSDTTTIPDPATLTVADLVQSDPPPKLLLGRPTGVLTRFKELIKTKPNVWFEYPRLTSSGVGQTNKDGYEWTSRTVRDDDGNKIGVKIWARYVG